MKYLLIFILIMTAVYSKSQTIDLEIPYGFKQAFSPTSGYEIVMDVDSVKNTVQIFASDGNLNYKFTKKDRKTFGKNRDCNAWAIPLLQKFEIINSPFSINYIFGIDGAEDKDSNSVDAAVINIAYIQGDVSDDDSGDGKREKNVINTSEIYTSNYNTTYPNILNKGFLRVNASNNHHAKISITGNKHRVNVKIVILKISNGKQIGILNPLTSGHFITNKDVYVIPLIRPVTRDKVYFEIGDPRVNGSISVTEDPTLLPKKY